jgi:hypothetical protein
VLNMRNFTITVQHCVNGPAATESMQAESIADAVVAAAERWPHAAKLHVAATPVQRPPQPGCFSLASSSTTTCRVLP